MNLNYLKYFVVFTLCFYSLNAIKVFGQIENIKFILLSENKSQTTLKLKTDNKSAFFSLGIGASPYKFINLISIEANIIFHFQQDIFLKTGLIYFKTIQKENQTDNSKQPLYLNFYCLYNFMIQKKINAFGGLGFAIYPLAGILFSIDIMANYQINSYLYLGFELKQALNSKYDSYYKYPFPSINLILKL